MQVASWFNSRLEWIRTHPWIGTAFGAGLLIGALESSWIRDERLNDAAATILGSSIGAAIAVLGAAWVALERETRTIKQAQSEIGTEFADLQQAFHDLIGQSLPNTQLNLSSIHPSAKSLVAAAQIAKKRMDRMEQLFHSVGAIGHISYPDAQHVIDGFVPIAQGLEDVTRNPSPDYWAPRIPEDLFREEWKKAQIRIQTLTAIQNRFKRRS